MNGMEAEVDMVQVNVIEDDVNDFVEKISPQVDEHLSAADRDRIVDVLVEYKDVFAASATKTPKFTTTVEHSIDTGDAKPIKMNAYRTSKMEERIIQEEVDEMLRNGIIRKSSSPWSFPIVLVDKPDGSKRFCIDYRRLNEVTRKDSYPLPRIVDTIDVLNGAKLFSTIDFLSGYWQIPLDEESIPKTAFVTKFGLFEWLRMPFGLSNAPSTFQRCMDVMLSGLTWKCCLVYLDDILVFSRDVDEHVENLKEILGRLRSSGFSIKLSKCWFGKSEATYLGHLISSDGVKPLPSKIEAVKNFKVPENLKEVRSFLGLVNYYHRFVPNMATIAEPLYALMKKNVHYKWSEQCQKAFEQIKEILVRDPILRYPNFEREFILHTDASDVGVGAVLAQLDDDGKEYVVSYASRSLSKEEKNYTVTERECLAVIFATKQFRSYIYGNHFTVYTDHASLNWLVNLKDANGRLMRWALKLQGLNFTIKYRKGAANENADALSRLVPDTVYVRALTRAGKRRNALKVADRADAVMSEAQADAVVNSESTGVIADSSSTDPPTVVIGRRGEVAAAKKKANQEQDVDVSLSERFIQEQRKDEELIAMIEYLEKKKLPDDSNEAMKLKVKASNFVIEDQLLKRLCVSAGTKHSNEVIKQIVVPKALVVDVMKDLHDTYHGGHFGYERTLKKILERFWWSNVNKNVYEYCQSCEVCQYRNVPHRELESIMLSTPVADGPFERVGIDVIGPLPKTKNGNKYIVTFTDSFSRWAEAFYTSEVKEEWIAELIVCEFICRYGCPKYIVSDRGSNFLSALCMKVYELMKIKKVNTTAYRPMANGIVERFNGVLVNMLSKFAGESDWDTYISYVLYAYRSSYNSTIRTSPYQLVFGKPMSLPIDAMINKGDAFLTDRSDYADEIAYRLNEAHTRVKDLLKDKERRRMDQIANVKKVKEFNVGEMVLLRAVPKQGVNKKLNNKRWLGPYRILERINLVNYKLDIPGPGPKPHDIVHVDRLKKWFNREQMN